MADKEKLTIETVKELAPVIKEMLENGQSPTQAFTELGYSMHVVKAVTKSLIKVGAIDKPVAVAFQVDMTDEEVDTEVRKVFSIPEPIPEAIE